MDKGGFPKVSDNERIQKEFETANETRDRKKIVATKLVEEIKGMEEREKQDQVRYEAQLKHIHDAMMVQGGCENILRLAEAERIITKLREHRLD